MKRYKKLSVDDDPPRYIWILLVLNFLEKYIREILIVVLISLSVYLFFYRANTQEKIYKFDKRLRDLNNKYYKIRYNE